MAYMNQEKKAKIAAALKLVVPADWKYSLSVRHHSTIVMTIKSAPVDLLDSIADETADGYKNATKARGYVDVNHYHPDQRYEGAVLQTIRAIIKALNTDNHDRSDSQSDYFDVGHYVDLNIGNWVKPFVCTQAQVYADMAHLEAEGVI